MLSLRWCKLNNDDVDDCDDCDDVDDYDYVDDVDDCDDGDECDYDNDRDVVYGYSDDVDNNSYYVDDYGYDSHDYGD